MRELPYRILTTLRLMDQSDSPPNQATAKEDHVFHTFPLLAALVLNGSHAPDHIDNLGRNQMLQTLRMAAGDFRQEAIGCAAASHRPLRAGMDKSPRRQSEAFAIAESCRKDLLNSVNSVAQSLLSAFKGEDKTALIEQWQLNTERNIRLLNDPDQDQIKLGDQISRDFDDLMFDLSW